MTKILVTGGIGLVGSCVVEHLLEHGYQVRVIDRQPAEELRPDLRELLAQSEYAVCDINDIDGLRVQMRGCDQVVHMAALASPVVGAPEEVFRVNAEGTFKVFQAAAEAGIKRVVQASSINALGLYYGVRNTDPLYFPVDEEHPHQGTDAYSFSKWVVEEIGEYFWRREGISSVALRFPGVIPPQWREEWGEFLGKNDLVERLLNLPEPARRAWVADALAEIDGLRRQRLMESRAFHDSIFGPNPPLPPEKVWLLGTRNNLFTLIDTRDASQAVEKGLRAAYEGAHALFVNDKNNTAGYESEVLLDLFYPEIKARKHALVGQESLVSIAKARRLIGFEPEFGWS